MKQPLKHYGALVAACLTLGALPGCRATELAECQDLVHALADSSADAWNTPADTDLGPSLERAVRETNAVVLVSPELERARTRFTQALQKAVPIASRDRELAKRTLGHETSEALGYISLRCSAER